MKLTIAFVTMILLVWGCSTNPRQEKTVTIEPEVYANALDNPLKGFRPRLSTAVSDDHPYSSLAREYLKWNELENDASDGIEKIIAVCDQKWEGVADKNVKIIPRVYLDWDEKEGNEYWPSDMSTGDYSSDQFNERLSRLVLRLGEIWDYDPRIAWVQMGIIGYWGEQHHPRPDSAQQAFLGALFSKAFKNKKVLVRRPFSDFGDLPFGWYWDSFAHWNQITSQAEPMMENQPDRWKVAPIEGETAYNWGEYKIQPGDNPDKTLSTPVHRDFLIEYIRKLHCTALGWVAEFDVNDQEVLAGAEEVQRALGYRFLLKEFSYPKTVKTDEPFSVSFKVQNTGSAPFYYNWPVALSLLDPETREVVWRQSSTAVDIRTWMPGDQWNEEQKAYEMEAPVMENKLDIQLDSTIPAGKYILAFSILDPGGMVPAVKFATTQYFNGGLHPLGYIGIETKVRKAMLNPEMFDDPGLNESLYYVLNEQ